MGIIPARRGVAFSVKQGQNLTVINTHGRQAVDFWAFSPKDNHDFLSMVHTRTILAKVSLSVGDRLYSTRRKPLLTLVRDTTPGVHDMVWSACDKERYRMMGYDGDHDNCSDNFHQALKENYPDYPVSWDWTPDPLNLFMNVTIDHDGSLEIKEPLCESGQLVTMRAEVDLIIIMSACPQDLGPCNGGTPTDCEYRVTESDTRSSTAPTVAGI